jgi:tetraacyldisaccharide 4'-kinase
MVKIWGIVLLPISFGFGLITWVRNLLFDWGIFPSKKHQVKIISVGNLSMGGTGKTPHVEYLVRQLHDNYKIATLSRGYGRKTKGFVLADENADANSVGDEPLQYYRKFKDILVAVDGNRNRGVRQLMKDQDGLDVVLLDDAYQHRWIKRDLSILLTDYHQLFYKDYVFPSGKLREFRSGMRRADIIIVTKTPVVLSPITRRRIMDEMRIKPYQKLLFSKIVYDGFINVKTNHTRKHPPKVSTIVLFTGIANSYPLQEYLQKYCNEMVVLTFPDHHNFSEKDIHLIHQTFDEQFTKNKMLVTTEKDTQRLLVSSQKEVLFQHPIFYVPIHIVFHNNDAEDLNQTIRNSLF